MVLPMKPEAPVTTARMLHPVRSSPRVGAGMAAGGTLGAGPRRREAVQRNPVPGADIRAAPAGLDPIGGAPRFAPFPPPPLFFVPAIAGLAAAIPVIVIELDRHL